MEQVKAIIARLHGNKVSVVAVCEIFGRDRLKQADQEKHHEIENKN